MLNFALIERAAQPTAVVRATIPVTEIPAFLGPAYGKVMQALAAQGIAAVGPPFAYYLHAPTATIEIEAGFPVATPCAPKGEVAPGELPGGSIATVTHVGPYEAMMATYEQLKTWVGAQGLTLQEGMWEVYLSDPQQQPDSSKWQTEIYWPVARVPVLA